MLISVVVPIYNVRNYISKCLDSLEGQEISDIEFILINDGSTDESGVIAQEYVRRDSRFRYYEKKNGGLSDARNYGIERAKGEFIGFVDSDDWVEPNMFKLMHDEAILKNADIVVCNFSQHFSDTGEVKFQKMLTKPEYYDRSVLDLPRLLHSRSYAWNKIFHKRFFEKLSYRFPKGQHFEDSHIVYNMMLDAKIISIVPDACYNYRLKRPGAITGQINEKIFDIYSSMTSVKDKFSNHISENHEIEDAMNRIAKTHIFARFSTLFEHEISLISVKCILYSFYFLDKNFHGWRSAPLGGASEMTKTERLARQSPFSALRYLARSQSSKNQDRLNFERAKNDLKIKKDLRAVEKKYQNILSFGPEILPHIFSILSNCNVQAFADFGTLLGVVRDGDFVKGEQDIDIGVIANFEEKDRIKEAFVEYGFVLWREYKISNQVVEHSYIFWGPKNVEIKLDLNFYTKENGKISTFLFYQKPGCVYSENQRNAVRMTYSAPTGFIDINFKGSRIPIPENPEIILKEKYGESWCIPDPNWVYWNSPSATEVEEIGTFENFQIAKSDRSRFVENLPELQLRQLKLVEIIIQYCNENNLSIMAAEGTLLGAIRHQGYVPWDDDIDLAMPRSDYDKLGKLLKASPPKGALLWDIKTDRRYHLPFMKVVAVERGNFENTSPKNLAEEFSGPRIDIFPLDYVSKPNGLLFYLQNRGICIMRSAISWRRIKKFSSGVSEFDKKVAKFIGRKSSFRRMHRFLQRIAKLQGYRSEKKYLVNWMSSYSCYKEVGPIEEYETINADFEKINIPVPKAHHDILTRIYGDYMKEPALDRREIKSHAMRYRPKLPALPER